MKSRLDSAKRKFIVSVVVLVGIAVVITWILSQVGVFSEIVAGIISVILGVVGAITTVLESLGITGKASSSSTEPATPVEQIDTSQVPIVTITNPITPTPSTDPAVPVPVVNTDPEMSVPAMTIEPALAEPEETKLALASLSVPENYSNIATTTPGTSLKEKNWPPSNSELPATGEPGVELTNNTGAIRVLLKSTCTSPTLYLSHGLHDHRALSTLHFVSYMTNVERYNDQYKVAIFRSVSPGPYTLFKHNRRSSRHVFVEANRVTNVDWT